MPTAIQINCNRLKQCRYKSSFLRIDWFLFTEGLPDPSIRWGEQRYILTTIHCHLTVHIVHHHFTAYITNNLLYLKKKSFVFCGWGLTIRNTALPFKQLKRGFFCLYLSTLGFSGSAAVQTIDEVVSKVLDTVHAWAVHCETAHPPRSKNMKSSVDTKSR